MRPGCSNAKISQPWSLLKKEGESIGLLCRQNDGHNVMAWYRQRAGQNLQLLYSFYLKNEQAKGSNISVRFTVERPNNTDFNLNISPAKPEDSAVYFCASSIDTAPQNNLAFLQKPLFTKMCVCVEGNIRRCRRVKQLSLFMSCLLYTSPSPRD